jgi:hypothetical protein
MKRNVEKISHAGVTPFVYTDLGKDMCHTGDSQMAQDIYDEILQHDALSDKANIQLLYSYGNTQPLTRFSNPSF